MANTQPINPWITASGNVGANTENTLELDSDFQGLKLILIVYNKTENKRRIKEYNITKLNISSLRYTCFGIVGDTLNYEVFFDIVLNKLQIKIKNNNLFNLEIETKVMFLG